MSTTSIAEHEPSTTGPGTHGIPVMFDVDALDAPSREDAARAVVDALVRSQPTLGGGSPIESWWLIEAEDKTADRNDNSAGRVVFDEPAGYLVTQPLGDGLCWRNFTTDAEQACAWANEKPGAVVREVHLGRVL